MTEPRIVSLQVGLPRSLGKDQASDPMERPWTTGFFKTPVTEPLWLGKENLEGDGVADRKVHGGPEKAVLLYSVHHYPLWRDEHGWTFPFGGFGENLTIAGQTEADVCIGDLYGVGTAIIQISQPRQPCWKLSRRWRIRELSALVQANGRTGWYGRVIQEGRIGPGDGVTLLERSWPAWTVAEANTIMHHRRDDRLAALALADCPALAQSWRKVLASRAEGGHQPDTRPRLIGPNAEDGPS